MKKNVILVTGAAGYTGREVVRRLSDKGVVVKALVRNISKAESLFLDKLPNVEIVQGDMNDNVKMLQLLTGVDKAMLISSPAEIMAETQINFINAAKKANTKHIVKLSGIIADIHSPFRFARMHAEVEKKLEDSGIEFTQLRAGEFMHSYFRQVPAILHSSNLFLPMNNQKIASVDVKDVAEVAARILAGSGHEGKVYPLTGSESLSMSEVAERLSAVLGRKISYVNVSPADAKKSQLAAGLPPYIADALEELFAERRKGMESKVYSTIPDIFGFYPVTFSEFVLKNLAVFKGETTLAAF